MRQTACVCHWLPVLLGAVLLLAILPAAASSQSEGTVITVKPGQTLWSIARAHDVSVEDIVEANNLARADRIAIGQKLVIPPSTPSPAAVRPQAVVTVRAGQTLWSIARQHGVTVEAIAAANDLEDAHLLSVGQKLVIPASGRRTPIVSAAPARPTTSSRPVVASASKSPAKVPLVVAVRRGETLWSIARAYNVSVEAITKANGISNPNRLSIGQRLRIPGRLVTPRPAPVVAIPEAVRFGPKFTWPVRGDITSRFGPRGRRHHDGIDIGVPRGTSILASRGGEVIFSGWYYGYGRTVILDHGDDVTTLYGHASKLLVKRGDSVREGQVVGLVGCTGRCTGSHLHFEIRINGRAVNPITVFDVQRTVTARPSPERTSAPPAADAEGGSEATGEEITVRRSVVTNGPTVTTIREHVRQGIVILREEEAATTEGCEITRVFRTFQIISGALEQVAERATAERCGAIGE